MKNLEVENFIALDYTSSLKYLKKTPSTNDEEDKTLYVIAGPKGSGKSTLIANLYKKNILDVFYLDSEYSLSNTINNSNSINQADNTQLTPAIKIFEKLIKNSLSFCYETILSHPSKIGMINYAREQGYKIVSYFVLTNSPEINISRVKARHNQGGNDIPNDLILNKYERSIKNLKFLERISDETYYFNNSIDKPITSETDYTK